jgi:hypothetical protein
MLEELLVLQVPRGDHDEVARDIVLAVEAADLLARR